MSQTLILELSDEVYTTVLHQTETAETSSAYWGATPLEQRYRGDHEWQLCAISPASFSVL